MRFDELNKFDLGYNGFTDFEAGASSRQAEIDELKAELEREKQRTTDNYDACDDIVKWLETENDALQEAVNREREQATECYTDFHCAVAERDALQKQIDDVLKQRDSFIKAHHIAMDDVCNMKAERDALQKRIDDVVKSLEGVKSTEFRPHCYDYDEGWRDCAITTLNDLKVE